MKTHTPGPWHYSGDSLSHRSFSIYSPYGGVGGRQTHICTTNDLPHSVLIGRDAEEAEANARLIASAPEILEALEELVLRCDGVEGVRPDGSNIQTILAHSIIVRARGEAE